MNQVVSIWENLEPRKKVVVLLSSIVVFLAVLGLARVVSAPTMGLLYAGLDPGASGEIVAALEGQGVAYEVRGNAIYVDDSKRDQTRMSLANEGLPANGGAGYELLDSLSGFGTTSQMFDAAYWRAKEGELARTILASPQLKSARVHISNTSRRPFDRATKPTASVIVNMRSGDLSRDQAKAIRYLVASAVSGMSPEQVSVIDAMTGIVLAAGSVAESLGGNDTSSREATMRSNVERLLAARVGAGKAIVEVNIDANLDSEVITERVLDPESRVTLSSDVEEKSSSAQGGEGGAVTVASNLPDGDAAGGGGGQSSGSQTRERINFDVSEVRRERVKNPGEIRRISVAALIDGVTSIDENGEAVWSERNAEELASLKELIKSAVGFDAARGDVVTISSMEFAGFSDAGTLAESGPLDFVSANAMKIIQMAFLGVVALALGLFVLKPILTKRDVITDQITAATDQDVLEPDAMIGGGGSEIELNPEVLGPQSEEQKQIVRLKETVMQRNEDSSAILEDWLSETETETESA